MITTVRTLLVAILLTWACGSSSAAIFAVSSGTASVLYQIDLESGSVTTVGPTGVDHLTGLAYHAELGVLFAHQAYDSFDPQTQPGGLYQLDFATGQSQLDQRKRFSNIGFGDRFVRPIVWLDGKARTDDDIGALG